MTRTILFDGICNLCNRTVKFIHRHDRKKRFLFATLQSDFGREVLRKVGLPTDKPDTIIYIRAEKYYQKSTAALYIMRDLGGIWKLFFCFIIIPPFIRDLIYNIVSKNRYRVFGKRDECNMPF